MRALLLFAVLATLPAVAQQAPPVQIVAAENFYGGVAAQIAGPDAHVTSILSNPNQDPHEFTTDAATAKAVADADIVIHNGLGYDAWMDKLLAAPGKKDRVIIRVANLIGAKDGDNPHIWYYPKTMLALSDKLAQALTSRLPTEMNWNRGYSDAGIRFKEEIQVVASRIAAIKSNYPATTVTATEPVFGYMASALGFKMLNYDFQIAVMNDTEPSAAQTAAFEKSLNAKTVKMLFYNKQVSDPTTERLKKIAIQMDIPIVGVTETQPADQKTYVDWMNTELRVVERALDSKPGSFKEGPVFGPGPPSP
jgi:zinc/manganese transport system substrate-binding protein